MRALQWLKDSQSLPLKPVYAVFGDDPYLRSRATTAIIHLAAPEEADDLAVTRFDGKSITLADVLDELGTLPFFSKRRIVVVDDADTFVTRYRKDLENVVEKLGPTGILVLILKSLPSNTRIAKQIDGVGLSIDCGAPAEKDLVPWLTHLASSEFGTQLESEAARLLIELVGPEAGIAASEVEKLAVYVGSNRRIRRDDVAKVVEAGRIETVWKVLDAATLGETATAVRYLDDLLASGEHPIRLLAGMSSSLLKLHHAGRLRAARRPLEEACRATGLFSVDKVRRQHAHLGPGRVDRLPALLLAADLDLKGNSPLEPRAVLERLIVELAVARKD